MDDVAGILGALPQELVEVLARMPPPTRVQHDGRKGPIESAGHDTCREDAGTLVRRPGLVLRKKREDPGSGVVALEQSPEYAGWRLSFPCGGKPGTQSRPSSPPARTA